MKNKIIGFMLAVLVLTACQSPKEKAIKNIKEMEQNDSAFSVSLMQNLKTAYLDFATTYPDDEFAAEFLFKASQRAIVLNQANEAVEILAKLLQQYPKSSYSEEALFLSAYTYENNLNELPKAKALYEQFITQYPKAELNEDAKFALENLGKSPEDLLKEVQ
jgi:TolA-binding protein